MTKEQTNNWEEEFNAVFGEYWTKIGENLYQAFPHSDRTPIFVSQEGIKNFISKTISQEKEKWEKWKVLAEAMDNVPVGHRVTIKHLLGEDEWTLTRRNKYLST